MWAERASVIVANFSVAAVEECLTFTRLSVPASIVQAATDIACVLLKDARSVNAVLEHGEESVEGVVAVWKLFAMVGKYMHLPGAPTMPELLAGAHRVVVRYMHHFDIVDSVTRFIKTVASGWSVAELQCLHRCAIAHPKRPVLAKRAFVVFKCSVDSKTNTESETVLSFVFGHLSWCAAQIQAHASDEDVVKVGLRLFAFVEGVYVSDVDVARTMLATAVKMLTMHADNPKVTRTGMSYLNNMCAHGKCMKMLREPSVVDVVLMLMSKNVVSVQCYEFLVTLFELGAVNDGYALLEKRIDNIALVNAALAGLNNKVRKFMGSLTLLSVTRNTRVLLSIVLRHQFEVQIVTRGLGLLSNTINSHDDAAQRMLTAMPVSEIVEVLKTVSAAPGLQWNAVLYVMNILARLASWGICHEALETCNDLVLDTLRAYHTVARCAPVFSNFFKRMYRCAEQFPTARWERVATLYLETASPQVLYVLTQFTRVSGGGIGPMDVFRVLEHHIRATLVTSSVLDEYLNARTVIIMKACVIEGVNADENLFRAEIDALIEKTVRQEERFAERKTWLYVVAPTHFVARTNSKDPTTKIARVEDAGAEAERETGSGSLVQGIRDVVLDHRMLRKHTDIETMPYWTKSEYAGFVALFI